jgi:ABC-type glutathione transport system ATPase component
MTLEFRDVSLMRGSAWGPQQRVLDRVNLTLHQGERVALVGPSGAGKSTVGQLAIGTLRPTEGDVRLFGESTAAWTQRDWRRARQRVQLLHQDPAAMLNPDLPIEVSLTESVRLHLPNEDPTPKIRDVLSAVGLSGSGASIPGELSGGEQRRAGIARVLLTQPMLLVSDEPTVGLDAARKSSILKLILEHLRPDATWLLITHDVAAARCATGRTVVIDDGRIVEDLPGGAVPTTELGLAMFGMPAGRP